MNRKIYYDKIRILAMFLVIGVHAVGSIAQFAQGVVQETVAGTLDSINSLGVPIFFALSGLFILSKDYTDIIGFYKKRLIRIGIPYLIYSILYVCYFTGYEENNIFGIPAAYVKDILTANVHPTHWFVYSIIGLYFAAPFLSRMFHAISDDELKILFGGCLLVTVLCRSFELFGLSFGVGDVVFNSGALWSFIGAYSFNRLMGTKGGNNILVKYHLLISGILAVLYVISKEGLFSQIAVMFLLIDDGTTDDKNESIWNNLIGDISKHSYSVYLIHAAVISLLLRLYTNWTDFFIVKCFLIYIVVFLISFALVKIIDFLITDRIICLANRWTQNPAK